MAPFRGERRHQHPGGCARLLDATLDQQHAAQNELVHAIFDVSVDAKVKASVVSVLAGEDAPSVTASLSLLPPDGVHARGTFAGADMILAARSPQASSATHLRLGDGTTDDVAKALATNRAWTLLAPEIFPDPLAIRVVEDRDAAETDAFEVTVGDPTQVMIHLVLNLRSDGNETAAECLLDAKTETSAGTHAIASLIIDRLRSTFKSHRNANVAMFGDGRGYGVQILIADLAAFVDRSDDHRHRLRLRWWRSFGMGRVPIHHHRPDAHWSDRSSRA